MRRLSRVAAAAVSLSMLSGCGFTGVYSLPLPGAKAAGDDTYRVTVQFADVLDLVPFSAVKVQDATVGHVRSVELGDGHADVEVQLLDSVKLPANAVGRIAETSLLGEKFVALNPPTDGAAGQLKNGDVVPLARTESGATVEEVLGALSLVLNGAGLDQVRTITTELTNVFQGREDNLRSVLTQLDTLIGGLDAQKLDIIRALEGIAKLTDTLKKQEQVLIDAVDALPPALAVLADQRKGLTQMLVALDKLGQVGTKVVNASRDDVLANLRDLKPALTQLALASEDIPKSLDTSLLYPFSRGTPNIFHGDFGDIWLTVDLDPNVLARNFGLDLPVKIPDLPIDIPQLPQIPGVPLPGLPSGAALPSGAPSLPSVPGLPPITIPGAKKPAVKTPSSTTSPVPSPSGTAPRPAPRLPSKAEKPASDIASMLFGGLS